MNFLKYLCIFVHTCISWITSAFMYVLCAMSLCFSGTSHFSWFKQIKPKTKGCFGIHQLCRLWVGHFLSSTWHFHFVLEASFQFLPRVWPEMKPWQLDNVPHFPEIWLQATSACFLSSRWGASGCTAEIYPAGAKLRFYSNPACELRMLDMVTR